MPSLEAVVELLKPMKWLFSNADAVATLVAVGAAFYAWRQAEEAKRARLAEFRPYVTLSIKPPQVGSTPPQYILVLGNYGRLPALVRQIVVDPKLETNFAPNLKRGTLFIEQKDIPLAPNQEVETLFHTEPLAKKYTIRIVYEGPDSEGRSRQYETTYCLDTSYLQTLILDPSTAHYLTSTEVNRFFGREL